MEPPIWPHKLQLFSLEGLREPLSIYQSVHMARRLTLPGAPRNFIKGRRENTVIWLRSQGSCGGGINHRVPKPTEPRTGTSIRSVFPTPVPPGVAVLPLQLAFLSVVNRLLVVTPVCYCVTHHGDTCDVFPLHLMHFIQLHVGAAPRNTCDYPGISASIYVSI